MRNLKKVALALSLLLTVYIFSCVKVQSSKEKIIPDLVVELTPKKFTEFLKDKFPIEKDLTVGRLILKNPNVLTIDKNNKLEMKADILFDSLVDVEGSIDIAGNIKFNKENKTFYLQNPEIKKFRILKKNFILPDVVKSTLNTLINTFFKEMPIYKFDKGYEKYLVKDVRFIPISALKGDNVVNRSTQMDWYQGVGLDRRRYGVRHAIAHPERHLPVGVRPGRTQGRHRCPRGGSCFVRCHPVRLDDCVRVHENATPASIDQEMEPPDSHLARPVYAAVSVGACSLWPVHEPPGLVQRATGAHVGGADRHDAGNRYGP